MILRLFWIYVRMIIIVDDNKYGLNADTDFYQFIKEQLQGFQIKFYPCE